ncbi:MAG: HAMP domain-containing histidine kinase [Clostridia bacterium]|nr:HAMP domain-containing histidine kinase [Clostridia bacterium]
MKNNTKSKITVIGYVFFFLPLSVTVMIAIFIFNALSVKGVSIPFIAVYMLLYIAFATLVFAVVDVFRRRIMIDSPSDKILEATERIAKGDFSVRLSADKQYNKFDRYDIIMNNINKMVGELQKSEVLKTEFISNVSHEIKTPLTIIKNYAQALKADKISKEQKDKYIQVLINTTERLSTLVTNILKLNKLENQILSPEKVNVNLSELLSECIIAFESVCEQKNIEFNCDVKDIIAFTEPNYTEIIFNNLLSNAVKFSHVGGKIDVTLNRDGENVVFTVKDYGIGMTQEVGAHVFEKFYQGDTSHKAEGNGLGLALVKKVIDLLGGEITVKSILNQGSEFTVVFKGVINE